MEFSTTRTITTEIKDAEGKILKNNSTSKYAMSLVKKEYVYVQQYKYNKDKTNETKYLGYAKKDDGSTDTTKAYIDNTDPQCFVLDYGSFLFGVNLTFQKARPLKILKRQDLLISP